MDLFSNFFLRCWVEEIGCLLSNIIENDKIDYVYMHGPFKHPKCFIEMGQIYRILGLEYKI